MQEDHRQQARRTGERGLAGQGLAGRTTFSVRTPPGAFGFVVTHTERLSAVYRTCAHLRAAAVTRHVFEDKGLPINVPPWQITAFSNQVQSIQPLWGTTPACVMHRLGRATGHLLLPASMSP